jgi:hypothetical protein
MTFHLAGKSKVLVGLKLPGFLLFFLYYFYLFFDRLFCFVVEELVEGWILVIVLFDDPLHLPCLARPLIVVKAGHQ